MRIYMFVPSRSPPVACRLLFLKKKPKVKQKILWTLFCFFDDKIMIIIMMIVN